MAQLFDWCWMSNAVKRGQCKRIVETLLNDLIFFFKVRFTTLSQRNNWGYTEATRQFRSTNALDARWKRTLDLQQRVSLQAKRVVWMWRIKTRVQVSIRLFFLPVRTWPVLRKQTVLHIWHGLLRCSHNCHVGHVRDHRRIALWMLIPREWPKTFETYTVSVRWTLCIA